MKREELEVYELGGESVFSYLKAEADSVMDELEARIKELNAENIAKDMAGAELHNENKSLRFNLEDWKHKAEEMELAAKSFDAEIKRSHEKIKELEQKLEDVQNTMATENVDLGMENHKLKERIKELEAVISKLETSQPKWISVEERLPKENEEILFVEKDGCMHIGEMWSYDDNRKIFQGRGEPYSEHVTHWMPLPEPPTTEESSATEKEG